MGKTKIMANEYTNGADRPISMSVRGQKIEILPLDGSTMYLGRLLSLQNLHHVEITHRLKPAQAKFMSHKKELCVTDHPLRDRLELFNATVTPTALHGCGSWVITTEREQKVLTAQTEFFDGASVPGGSTRQSEEEGGVS